MSKHNPYYYPEKLALEMLQFDEPDMSYAYNTLCFWATESGSVYTAQDSGCSCPTPFEDYEAESTDNAVTAMERISSIEHAESILHVWNRDYDGKRLLSDNPERELAEWFRTHFKP